MIRRTAVSLCYLFCVLKKSLKLTKIVLHPTPEEKEAERVRLAQEEENKKKAQEAAMKKLEEEKKKKEEEEKKKKEEEEKKKKEEEEKKKKEEEERKKAEAAEAAKKTLDGPTSAPAGVGKDNSDSTATTSNGQTGSTKDDAKTENKKEG